MTLTRNGYRKRIMDDALSVNLDSIGATCVEGPKGCGKTWFSLNKAESAFMIGDRSNNFGNRRLAMLDVNTAFEGELPHLIDEWQEIPMIWDATKDAVDELNRFGCFILTGSSTPVIKGIDHSGTGRIGTIRLRTMSLYESGDSSGKISLMDLFDNDIAVSRCDMTGIDGIIYLTMRGGWPMLIGKKSESVRTYLNEYVSNAIEDISRLDGGFADRKKIARVFRSLARNESQTVGFSKIVADSMEEPNDGSSDFSRKMNLSENTVHKYIDAMDRLFLIEDQYVYSPNVKSNIRVGKLPKRHLTDPSLSIAALGLSEKRLKSDPKTLGYFFEAMCVRDLTIYAEANGGKVFHYRDNDGREIDAIVELDDGRWGAVEIKLGGDDEIDKAAKNLKSVTDYWERKGLEYGPSFLCVIYGVGDVAYRRDDGVLVVPITALKN